MKELRDFFFHEHPLMLTGAKHGGMTCRLCFVDFGGYVYSCRECQFEIHKSCAESELHMCKTCAELPKVIQNSYHPHPLTLVTRLEEEAFKCAACLQNHLGFAYHCGNCNFDLDTGCAFQKLTIDEGQDQLHHLTHPHPLIATEKKRDDGDGDDVSCKICGEPISDVLYGCDPCNFYLHQSCAELQLPPTIQHFYHPCLLTLCLDARRSNCKACGKFCGFYSYLCKPCNFMMEISCALLPVIKESQAQKQFHHFCHGHPLKLKDIKHEDNILCSACQKCCSGETYVCCSNKCKFFLHTSCFNLPQNIHHPSHPHHPLTMHSPIQRQYIPTCRVCYRFCSGFTYSCNQCRKFDMDVVCPATISTIEYQGHHHNLLFADGREAHSPGLWCSACGKFCESSTPMFHCAQCDFHLHFNCGPLPCFIKHENHPCPLKLTDSPVMIDGGDKGGDWFICDVCEEDRDPRLPVYCCSKGCAYIAEIKCVISEVLHSLLGENGNVELRSTIFKHKTGKVVNKGIELVLQESIADSGAELCKLKVNSRLTLEEIINALSELEKREIETVLNSTPSSDQDHDLWLTEEGAVLYSGEDFRKRMALMDTYGKVLLVRPRKETEVINVGNHLVISELAPILEDLCAKYGEIIPESTLQSSGARTVFVHMLCDTIREMSITRIADISQRQLILWWRNLKSLQHVGFKVEFVFNRLKRVVHSYYALELERKAKEDLEQIRKEMEEVSQDIDQLEAKVVAQKAKLGRLKERYERRELPEHASSSILVNSFKEAAEHRWAVVGEGLL